MVDIHWHSTKTLQVAYFERQVAMRAPKRYQRAFLGPFHWILGRPCTLRGHLPVAAAAASALIICETGLPEQHRFSRCLHISWYNKITFANVTTGLSLGKLATTRWQTQVFQNSNNWLKAWILSLATNKVGCHFWSDRLTSIIWGNVFQTSPNQNKHSCCVSHPFIERYPMKRGSYFSSSITQYYNCFSSVQEL